IRGFHVPGVQTCALPIYTVIADPVHPYTQSLLSAIPVLHGLERPGEQPVTPVETMDGGEEESGCLFAPRCPFRGERCAGERPVLQVTEGFPQEHACFYPERRSVVARPMSEV